MDVDKIELKTAMTAAEAAAYLASLAEGFKAGRIVVEKGGERLALTPDPDGPAEAEIEARIKKGKARFTLELTWRMLAEDEAGEPLRIRCDAEPCAEAAEASDKLDAGVTTPAEIAETAAPAETTDATPATPAEIQEAAPATADCSATVETAAEAADTSDTKPKGKAKR